MPSTHSHNTPQDALLPQRLRLTSILALTQAININTPARDLYDMYTRYLASEMHIERMAFYIQIDTHWKCVSSFGSKAPRSERVLTDLLHYKRISRIQKEHDHPLSSYSNIIPVYHKENPIAFLLLEVDDNTKHSKDQLHFISALTNILAVAVENKRLFKKELEQTRIEKELKIAARVQLDLVPEQLPHSSYLHLDCLYQPHSEVGGDYYDYITLDDDRALIVLADISGKGIPAALLMSNFQAYIQALTRDYTGLEDLIVALNTCVYSFTRSERFVSAFIAEYDTQNDKLHYVNAGHPTPLLFQDHSIARLDKGCTLLGAIQSLPHLEIGCIKIQHSSTLIAFTDGLSELKNENNQYFDEANIIKYITNNHHLQPDDFNHKLSIHLNDFKGNQTFHDDMAVLTARFTPKSKQSI